MHRRLFEEFEIQKLLKEYGGCVCCGWCCKNERLTIFKDDVIRLGSLLKPEHIHRQDEISVSFIVPCPFIKGKRCGVYNRRSDVCKTYPFLLHYLGMFAIAIDCPLGKKIADDIMKYCEYAGIKIVGDESKTEAMKLVDKLVEDRQLNTGGDFESKIMNISFDMFREFLEWRKKHVKKH